MFVRLYSKKTPVAMIHIIKESKRNLHLVSGTKAPDNEYMSITAAAARITLAAGN
jgi:hypothetical protein